MAAVWGLFGWNGRCRKICWSIGVFCVFEVMELLVGRLMALSKIGFRVWEL